MFWLLTLPFRIVFGLFFGLLSIPFALLGVLFGLLFLPFLLIRFVVKAAVTLVLFPFVVVIALIGVGAALLAASVALAVPLLPLAFVAFCVWAILRLALPAVLSH